MSETYLSTHTGAEIDAAVDKINILIDLIYPVGSVYTNVNSVMPNVIASAGTWTALNNGSPLYLISSVDGTEVTIKSTEHHLNTGTLGMKVRTHTGEAPANAYCMEMEASTCQVIAGMPTNGMSAFGAYMHPTNLYGDVTNASISIYAWKRTA